MVQFWDSIPNDLRDWALKQQIFFTASAPSIGKHVNISPKGLPSTTFSIFGPNSAAYVDATGSGAETISHLYENGRITIMFCSFSKSPRIMRFFCRGTVVEWDSPRFAPLLQDMGKAVDGARAVILLDVFKVQTSCGFGVPLLTTNTLPTPHSSPSTSSLAESDSHPQSQTQPILLDRETMGHWARTKITKNALLAYQADNNSSSLDGCTGLRAAMRDHGERVWLSLGRAWVRRAVGQREGVVIGLVLGILTMVLWQWLWGLGMKR